MVNMLPQPTTTFTVLVSAAVICGTSAAPAYADPAAPSPVPAPDAAAAAPPPPPVLQPQVPEIPNPVYGSGRLHFTDSEQYITKGRNHIQFINHLVIRPPAPANPDKPTGLE